MTTELADPAKDYFIWMVGALIWQYVADETYGLFYLAFALFCTVMMFVSYVNYIKLPAEQQFQLIESNYNG